MIHRLLSLFLIIIVSVQIGYAQFVGNFGEGDPDAWFDKEIFFACQNQTPYAYSNVILVVNNEKMYTYPYSWYSGYYLTIGKSNGVSLSSGDKVDLWIGNQYIGGWYCPKSPSYKLPRTRGGGKAASKILKGAWKYLKRIK